MDELENTSPEISSDPADESIDGPSDAAIFKDFGIDPEKYGINDDAPEVAPAAESQGSDDAKVEAGQATDEKSFLERVNALGAVREGQPIQVESMEEVKAAIQTHRDYTVKTQALSEERKVWEAEKSRSMEQVNASIQELNTHREQYGAQLQELEQWKFTLQQLQESAPDLLEEVKRAHEGVVRQFSNPVLNQQLSVMQSRIEKAEKALSSRENEVILSKFDSDKQALGATEQSLAELGVKVDWDAVKKQWADTGLPLKQVVGSMYFDHVTKAQASKTKVEATKIKTTARPTGAAAQSRPGSTKPNTKGMSYLEAAQKLYENMR